MALPTNHLRWLTALACCGVASYFACTKNDDIKTQTDWQALTCQGTSAGGCLGASGAPNIVYQATAANQIYTLSNYNLDPRPNGPGCPTTNVSNGDTVTIASTGNELGLFMCKHPPMQRDTAAYFFPTTAAGCNGTVTFDDTNTTGGGGSADGLFEQTYNLGMKLPFNSSGGCGSTGAPYGALETLHKDLTYDLEIDMENNNGALPFVRIVLGTKSNLTANVFTIPALSCTVPDIVLNGPVLNGAAYYYSTSTTNADCIESFTLTPVTTTAGTPAPVSAGTGQPTLNTTTTVECLSNPPTNTGSQVGTVNGTATNIECP